MKKKSRERGGQYLVIWTCLTQLILFLAVGMLIAFLCACASHKDVVDVTIEESDSISKIIDEEYKEFVINSNASSASSTDYEDSIEDSEEVITEHIVSVTDSLGNITTTTDRTTKRKVSKNSSRKNTTDITTATIDSTGNTYSLHYNEFMTKCYRLDSLQDKSSMQCSNPAKSWWQSLVDMFRLIVIGTVLASIVFLAIKYISSK